MRFQTIKSAFAVALFVGLTISFSVGAEVAVAEGPAVTGQEELASVSCATAVNCVAAGTYSPTRAGAPFADYLPLLATTNTAGASWSTSAPPPGFWELSGVACPTISRCVAVGGLSSGVGVPILVSNDGGTTWSVPGVSGLSISGLKGVSCPTANFCMAAGTAGLPGAVFYTAVNYIVTTENGGATWSVSTIPSALFGSSGGSITSITCSSPADCDVSDPGTVVSTTDGGGSWTASTLPGTAPAVSGLSCGTSGSCTQIARIAVPRRTRGSDPGLSGPWSDVVRAGASRRVRAALWCFMPNTEPLRCRRQRSAHHQQRRNGVGSGICSDRWPGSRWCFVCQHDFLHGCWG